MLLSSLVSLLVLASCARTAPSPRALRPARAPRPSMPRLGTPSEDVPVVSRNGTQLPAYSKVYWFNQLIDHTNPSLGTFRQRYWHTYEFYEPGA